MVKRVLTNMAKLISLYLFGLTSTPGDVGPDGILYKRVALGKVSVLDQVHRSLAVSMCPGEQEKKKATWG